MCTDGSYLALGAFILGEQLAVLEQCTECAEYRARTLDPYSLPVVEGEPEATVGASEETEKERSGESQEPTSGDDDDDESTGWLVDG